MEHLLGEAIEAKALTTGHTLSQALDDIFIADDNKAQVDLADAIHLAACGNAIMHTFDQGFCKAAQKAGLTPKIGILKAEQK